MTKELPNYDISHFDFNWNGKMIERNILFYKNAVKVTKTKTVATEIRRKRPEIPLWKKSNLTIEEAAVYSGIGKDKLREITDREDCPFVLWIGSKRLIRREKFDKYLDNAFSL